MNKLLEDAKGIIFDVDGLMIDSEPLWDKAREEFAASYGKRFTSSVNEKVRGRGMKGVIAIMKEDLGIEGDIDDLVKKFRDIFYNTILRKNAIPLMPGTKEIVSALFTEGKKLGIATSGHPQDKMRQILRSFEIEKYFSVIVSGDQVQNGKPAPDIFLFAASELGLSTSECVILEDAVSGVQAGKNANIKVIGVQKDKHVARKLRDVKADLVVASLRDLL